jgi:hypothetical protein
MSSGLARLGRDVALDEIERGVRDFLPAVVDSERVAAVRDLHDLRHPQVVSLPLVRGIRDRPRHRVVPSTSMISKDRGRGFWCLPSTPSTG